MVSETRSSLYYGWIVVGVTVLTLIVSAGIRSSPGVMIIPLEADTGWSRDTLSLGASIGLLLFGLAGPLAGTLIDRYGPKRIMLVGLLLMILSTGASMVMTAEWQLLLFWGALSGLGTGLAAAVLGAAVANRWFVARRGLVLGIFGAATSAGQLIFLPALIAMIEAIGWRNSTAILAGIATATLLPVILLMRDSPQSMGLRAYGAAENAPPPARPASVGVVMGGAVRSPTFWLLASTFFICGFTSNGIVGTHLVPHAVDHGITQGIAAGALALMGTMNFVGTLASGYLTDRYDPRVLLACYYGFRGVSLLFLPFVDHPLALTAFAVLFGLDYIATVPPTTALTADSFGRANVGTVFGWIFCAHQVGAALAAWLGGVTRVALGDYGPAFIGAGALAGVAVFLSLRIRRESPLVARAA
jgi:sugar phosphate permease